MTSGHLHIATSPATTATEQPRQALRLKLKPKAPTTGYVDGAWWPRSRDLSTELPPLLAVLAIRLGRLQRVSYNLTTWDAAPRRVHIDGHQVRLSGFRTQHPHTVDVIGLDGLRLTLLVLPPRTDPVTAHQVMMAARRDNNASIDDLLATVVTAESGPTATDLADDHAAERWEVDGGRVRYFRGA
ncbi:DUF5994 family protein [Allokutzneria sp. NRRL B-24872]|uniref:DUF5994 family protein n=1 Tax=Allokutzneria sp. NRRL B-24872 TaxID=1137961 RepID=UPI001FF015AD|nr:DUF5994 family protein [Allokutzneria sp. NRRL B-24872]